MTESELIVESLELIEVNRIKCEMNSALIQLNSDSVTMIYVHDGRGLCSLNDVNYTVKDGDMVLISPAINYRLVTIQDKPLRAIQVSYFLQLNGRERNYILAPDHQPVLSLGKYQQLMGSYLEQIYEEVSSPSVGAKELLRSLLQAITIWIVRYLNQRQEPNQLSPAFQVKTYIEQNFVRDLSLADLALHVHVSPYHLGHLFKEECGLAPIQYLIQCRIEEAKRLLRESSYSILDVAEAVGYPNPNYFNQMFKKMVGISPGKYRNSGDRPR